MVVSVGALSVRRCGRVSESVGAAAGGCGVGAVARRCGRASKCVGARRWWRRLVEELGDPAEELGELAEELSELAEERVESAKGSSPSSKKWDWYDDGGGVVSRVEASVAAGRPQTG